MREKGISTDADARFQVLVLSTQIYIQNTRSSPSTLPRPPLCTLLPFLISSFPILTHDSYPLSSTVSSLPSLALSLCRLYSLRAYRPALSCCHHYYYSSPLYSSHCHTAPAHPPPPSHLPRLYLLRNETTVSLEPTLKDDNSFPNNTATNEQPHCPPKRLARTLQPTTG